MLPRPAEVAAALGWLDRASLPLSELGKPRNVRLALDALTLRLDGTSAVATTIHRKRSVFYNVLEYAAELEELSANSLDRVKSKVSHFRGWRVGSTPALPGSVRREE